MAVTITRTAGVDDDGSGTSGTVVNAAWKAELYGQIDTALALLLGLAGGTLTGDLKFTDATYDIGKSGATRPRDGFFSRNLVIGGSLASGALAITGAANAAFLAASGAGTGFTQADVTNTGGTMRFGVEASAGGSLFVGDSAYAGVVGTSGATALEFGTGATIRVTISAAGLLTAKLGMTITGAGLVVGAPTGGDKGAGTINATAVYDDNVLLTDDVFEPAYVLPSIADMQRFFTREKHLPTIPGRAVWEADGKFSLGRLATHLWETVEVQARYIADLNARLMRLEHHG